MTVFRWIKDQCGSVGAEYALLLATIGMSIAGAAAVFGDKLTQAIARISDLIVWTAG